MSETRNFSGQLSLAQAVSSANAFQAEAGPSRNRDTNSNRFKAPAHKHAHHLHSIPPREKSTRTLIIDHMLWVHGRTRFAQARAELGMTDRTGGPSSSNYVHRRRPENYEEDDEAGSDGEEVSVLKARHEPDDDDESRIHAQDLQLARSLRLRAEGLEKVINSMLVQPPPIHLHFEDDLFVDPNQHTLPNGVRLRLALGTFVNDFFARQAPPPPFRHKKYATVTATASSPMTTTTSDASSATSGLLPLSLSRLVPISAYGERKAEKRARKLLARSNASASSSNRSYPSFAISHSMTMTQLSQPCDNSQAPAASTDSLSSRTRTLYSAGADPDTANSPPAFRCPRHLHNGCEICVEAKNETNGKGAGGKGKARERAGSTNLANAPTPGSTFAAPSWPSTSVPGAANSKPTPIGIAPDGGGISGYQDPSTAGGCSVGVGEGLLKPSLTGNALRRRTASPYTRRPESETDSTGSGYTKLSELVPRFIRLSALVAVELGREVKEGREGKDLDELNSSPKGMATKQGVGGRGVSESCTLAPSREWYHLLAAILTRATLQGYLTAGWRGVSAVECLMGVGLGIVLPEGSSPSTSEGRDSDHFTEGEAEFQRGVSPSPSDDPESDADADMGTEVDMFSEDEDLFKEFNPDELPSLQQAVGILFPSLGVDGSFEEQAQTEEETRMDTNEGEGASYGSASSWQKRRKRQPNAAEAEFANEMNERLRKFFAIPSSTPDLSTHMEDLAWQYPAEPMERAAARFCEAIAGWRGKPELEGYKKKPPRTWASSTSAPGTGTATSTTASTPMTMESLVHSSPTTPTLTQARQHSSSSQNSTQGTTSRRPSIDMYFLHPRDLLEYRSSGEDGGDFSTNFNNSGSPVTSSPSAQTQPRLDTAINMNTRRQSFQSASTNTYSSSSSGSSRQSHLPTQSRSNSYSQPTSNVGTSQFTARPSRSPRSPTNPVPSPSHHQTTAAQYAYPSQTSQSNAPAMMSHSSSLVGQQIPVWNPTTGTWVSATPSGSQGMVHGLGESAADIQGNKRTRSPERPGSMGVGPNSKRTR